MLALRCCCPHAAPRLQKAGALSHATTLGRRGAGRPGFADGLCVQQGAFPSKSLVVAGSLGCVRLPHSRATTRPREPTRPRKATEVVSGMAAPSTHDIPQDPSAASNARVSDSMNLLQNHSTESHPGHQPGRFEGPGDEYSGMIFDGVRWHLAPEAAAAEAGRENALARLSDSDQVLVTKFEAEGGLALCLSNAFKGADRLRAEAERLLTHSKSEKPMQADAGSPKTEAAIHDPQIRKDLDAVGLGPIADVLPVMPLEQQAKVFMHAAGMVEEREAVMRNVWSDVEFQCGDVGNAELVAQLEMQFANQLVKTAGHLKERRAEGAEEADEEASAGSADDEGRQEMPRQEDAIFDVALSGCSQASMLSRHMAEEDLNELLLEPRNLGVALDLVGVYLKNYEIDKADLVVTRIVPLARERGGTWLVKALDKMSAVRMKQFRAQDALEALEEIEQVVPFSPQEGWEFHDILYRNLAWCYSSLDEPEKCFNYTKKSVEVKRRAGIQPTWFDMWDLAKGHARLGQKNEQLDEMQIGYELCKQAADIHRKAEPSDTIMLAKILSNVGEIAMGIGDHLHVRGGGSEEEVRAWYERAEPDLLESYSLHTSALGPMKPLSGWAAGTLAHCMVRLRRWDVARDYLALAMKVECTKDSTTPGSVLELLDRVTAVHNELEDVQGMAAYLPDLRLAMDGLIARRWDQKDQDAFTQLQQRVSTTEFLVQLLQDAEIAGTAEESSVGEEEEELGSGSEANLNPWEASVIFLERMF